MLGRGLTVLISAALCAALVAEPAVAGTDSGWVYAKSKAARGRFVHYGDWLQVCDLKKKDGWAAGIFLYGAWSDGDEQGAVIVDKPGGCKRLPFQYVLMEGTGLRVKVCRVRRVPWKLTGCSRFVKARA
jgi:hypothetical protein